MAHCKLQLQTMKWFVNLLLSILLRFINSCSITMAIPVKCIYYHSKFVYAQLKKYCVA